MDDLKYLHENFDESEKSFRIVIVEDDPTLGKAIARYLQKKTSLEVALYTSPSAFLAALDTFGPSSFCLVTDISFDNERIDGLYLIDLLKERKLKFASLVMTGYGSIETAIAATKKGVFQYLTKPFELEALLTAIIEAACVQLGEVITLADTPKARPSLANMARSFSLETPSEDDLFEGMIGRSLKMKAVFERIKKVADSDSTVFVSGPSGAGKELVAQAIHKLSVRRLERMVSVNCGAIPGELLESELFGHEKGSFTGAITARKGRFEHAHNGTIFLDEIGDMPLLLQVKLLRVLQSRLIEPVGSNKSIDVNVRIITATHRDLEKTVMLGNFREDLYYRLNVIPIHVPSLCERREDIPLLVAHFLNKCVSADKRNLIEFSDEALESLICYDWPGNVRELENLVERLVVLRAGNIIRMNDLPAKFQVAHAMPMSDQPLVKVTEDGIDLKQLLSDIEDSLIKQALELTGNNKNQASKLLGLNRTTLIEKLKKKGFESLLN